MALEGVKQSSLKTSRLKDRNYCQVLQELSQSQADAAPGGRRHDGDAAFWEPPPRPLTSSRGRG